MQLPAAARLRRQWEVGPSSHERLASTAIAPRSPFRRWVCKLRRVSCGAHWQSSAPPACRASPFGWSTCGQLVALAGCSRKPGVTSPAAYHCAGLCGARRFPRRSTPAGKVKRIGWRALKRSCARSARYHWWTAACKLGGSGAGASQSCQFARNPGAWPRPPTSPSHNPQPAAMPTMHRRAALAALAALLCASIAHAGV